MKKETQIKSIEFYNKSLTTIKEGEIEYVAMRPIVEGIGLDWASQFVKLNNNKGKFGCCDITTPSKGGLQKTLCIPFTKLYGYLFSINPNRVRKDIKDQVILYQNECFEALYDHFKKGYSLNQQFLENSPEAQRELAKTIKKLRLSESSMYSIVKQVFKVSASDYDSKSQEARSFFAMAQDKFLYAITQKTASELKLARADATKPYMGITYNTQLKITKKDVLIGKNYLTDDELKLLENISEQFLLFAETKAFRKQKMTMEEISFKLNLILTTNEYPVLYEYDSYLKKEANLHIIKQLELYQNGLSEE